MNRIKISPLATASLEVEQQSLVVEDALKDLDLKFQPAESFSSEPTFDQNCQVSQTEYSLFVPLHYEKNYQYPLLVWLHDEGDEPDQLHRIMPSISLRNYVGVAPKAVGQNSQKLGCWVQESSNINYSCEAVGHAIDMASLRTNIASNRIFIGGYGAAGTMAFRVAFNRPELFAGVVSINGPVPEQQTPLSRWSHSRDLEVFWAHCRKSESFEHEVLCRQLKLLHVAGFSVTLRQYPGGDQLCKSALSDLNGWIMDMFDTTIS